MFDVLVRAGCFISIIIAGYLLRKFNFFKEGDFSVLSKIVLKITLPAAFISNFAGKEIDPAMLFVALLAFGMGVLYMIIGYLINIRKGKEAQAFGLLNLSGYNIGNFNYNNDDMCIFEGHRTETALHEDYITNVSWDAYL